MIESRLYTKTKDIYNTVNNCTLTYTQVDCSCGPKYENSEKIKESGKKIKVRLKKYLSCITFIGSSLQDISCIDSSCLQRFSSSAIKRRG